MKNIFIILFFVSFLLSDQEEKISYSVKYNGIKAGEATLEKKLFNDNINLIFNLKSRKFIDLLYKLRENISVIADKNYYSILSIDKSTQQGKYKKKYKATFNYESFIGQINSNEFTIVNSIYDPISIIYNLRDRILDKDKIFTYDIISKDRIKTIEMHVVGNEKIIINNIEYDCSILEAINTVDKEKIKQTDALKLWISSDEYALPIIIEKKAKSGTIKMEMESYQILK